MRYVIAIEFKFIQLHLWHLFLSYRNLFHYTSYAIILWWPQHDLWWPQHDLWWPCGDPNMTCDNPVVTPTWPAIEVQPPHRMQIKQSMNKPLHFKIIPNILLTKTCKICVSTVLFINSTFFSRPGFDWPKKSQFLWTDIPKFHLFSSPGFVSCNLVRGCMFVSLVYIYFLLILIFNLCTNSSPQVN